MNSKQRRKRRRERDGYGRFFRLDPAWHKSTPEFKREVIHQLKWLQRKLELACYEALRYGTPSPKVPYNTEGLKVIEDAVKKVLAEEAALNPPWTSEVTIVPPTEGDREARIVRNITFKVPIHPIRITGIIDV